MTARKTPSAQRCRKARLAGFVLSVLAGFGLCVSDRAAWAGEGDPSCPIDRPVMFGGLDWESAAFHTAVAVFILEEGYGCETETIPGSTIPLHTGLRRGDLDVLMEVWMDRVTRVWYEGVERGETASVGINYPGAVQGWYVPRYLVEGDADRGIEAMAPGLRSVYDLNDHWELFKDPENPRKARFYNCILGWSCEILNSKKLDVYDLSDRFVNFRPGTGAALAAAIASHYRKGDPFIAYYWDPSWVTGSFDLLLLEEPAYDQAVWEAFAEARRPKETTAYPKVDIHVGLNLAFRDANPELARFFTAYETTLDHVRDALTYLNDTPQAEARDAALRFLKAHPEVWRAWVAGPVADRVAAALQESQ